MTKRTRGHVLKGIFTHFRPIIIVLIIVHFVFIATTVILLFQNLEASSKKNTVVEAQTILKNFVIADEDKQVTTSYVKAEKEKIEALFSSIQLDASYKKPKHSILIGRHGFVDKDTISRIDHQLDREKRVTLSVQLNNSMLWITITSPLRKSINHPAALVMLFTGVVFPSIIVAGLLYFYFLMYQRNVVDTLVTAIDPSGEKKSSKVDGDEHDEKIVELKNKIDEMFSQKTLMLTSLAHDINTPILKLRLQADDIKNEKLRAGIFKEINFIQTVIESSLTIGKGAAVTMNEEKFDLTSSLKRLYDNYFVNNQAVIFHLPENIMLVNGDPALLHRTVVNFIENAIKFATHVDLYLKKHGKFVEIIIEDDGPGIPEEEMDRLFKPFQQLSRHRKGAGLGLAIAKKIVELHRGNLTIENRKKQSGLRVVISLGLL